MLFSRILGFLHRAGAVVFEPVSVVCARCAFSDAPDGERYLKRFKFWASEDWIKELRRLCACRSKKHAPLFTVQRAKGVRRHTGLAVALRESGAYPPALGAAVVDAWLRSAVLDTASGSAMCPRWALACPPLDRALACPPLNRVLACPPLSPPLLEDDEAAAPSEPDLLSASGKDTSPCCLEDESDICGSSSSA